MSDWFSARKHSSYMNLFREIMATSDPKLACLREILLNWPALLEKLHISVFFSPYLKLLGNGYPMLEVSRHPWRVRNGRSPSREPWKAGISWDLSGICKIFVTGALVFFFGCWYLCFIESRFQLDLFQSCTGWLQSTSHELSNATIPSVTHEFVHQPYA